MYMAGDEIRALSRRIPEIVNATDEELSFWMEEASDIIHSFCQQDFTYERQVTRRVRFTTNTLVYLPKVISGQVSIEEDGTKVFSSKTSATNEPSNIAEVFQGKFVLGFYKYNTQYPNIRGPKNLYVTGDWGFFNTLDEFIINGTNFLKSLYQNHRLSTVSHNQADSLNVVALPDATDLDSVALLLNELKGVLNSHFGDFVVHKEADTNLSNVSDVVDQSTAIQLLEDLVKKFNSHIANESVHLEEDADNVYTNSIDYDSAVLPKVIRRVFLRLVQRLAIRDDVEDHRQINSPYTTETLGDGYTYDLGNGTLRNLLRPDEANMLLPYVNRGNVVV